MNSLQMKQESDPCDENLISNGNHPMQQYQLIPQQDGIIFAVPTDGNNYPVGDEIEENDVAANRIDMAAVSAYMQEQAPPADERPARRTKKQNHENFDGSFPYKLWSLINDASYSDVIHFSLDGSCVVFPKEQQFVDRVLRNPAQRIFKTESMKSFVRQLNLYGFHKVQLEREACFEFLHTEQRRNWPEAVFQHASFAKGRLDLLEHVKRRCKVKELKKNTSGKKTKKDRKKKVISSISYQQTVEESQDDDEAYNKDYVMQTFSQYPTVQEAQTIQHFMQQQNAAQAAQQSYYQPVHPAMQPTTAGRSTKRRLNFCEEKEPCIDHKKSYVYGAPNEHQYPINMPQMLPMQWGAPTMMNHPGQYFPTSNYMMRPARLHDYSQLNHQLAAIQQAMNMHGHYPPHFAMMPPAWQYPQQQPPQAHQQQPLAPFADTFYHNVPQCQQKKTTPPGAEGQSSSNDDETPSGIHPLASGSTSPSSHGSTGNKMPPFNSFSPLSAFCANLFQPYLQSSPLIQVVTQAPSSSQGSHKSSNACKADDECEGNEEECPEEECENEEQEELEEREACAQEMEEKEEALMSQEGEEEEHYFEEPEYREDEECAQYEEYEEGEYEEEEEQQAYIKQQAYVTGINTSRNSACRSSQNAN